MRNNLKFRISAALKDIIGKDLITDDYIAIFELVKNSFDAYAKRVDIYFEDIYGDNPKIIIKDDGKGMTYDDLINKWLFVAYSAKKEGVEDKNFDYRKNISIKRAFAGAKGIGRFACDKLGKQLVLETTYAKKNAPTEMLYTDWELFENDLQDEFVNISVLHETINASNYGLKHGTVLEINELRNKWDRDKLLKLKSSLAKLINPKTNNKDKSFKIVINAPDELERDSQVDDDNSKVNGEVQNFIFETLGLKTTKIVTKISKSGKFTTTELKDGGTLIYKIKEKNRFPLLKNIHFTIFYLNQSAKLTFARRMGLPSVRYGHIFLYNNGFRIYPYGEPGEDTLKVDLRKTTGYRRYLGTGEIIGQIEINTPTEELKETSSRGDGLIKTNSYNQLVECFWEVLRRLEKYVVNVQKWGLSIEEDHSQDIKTRYIDLLAKLTESNEILEFNTPDNFLDIIEQSQSNSVEAIIKNINRIALESNSDKLVEQAELANNRLYEIQKAREEAEKEARIQFEKAQEATKKLKAQVTENLFLKSINSSDYKEVISLLHHIGIYAGTIDNKLKGISLRVQNEINLSNEDLLDIIRSISFETKKILNITSFATKANFKLDTEFSEVNLADYIREYVQNIIPSVTDKSLKINFKDLSVNEFVKKVKPIELNIVIDNLINNAYKAKANQIDVVLSETQDKKLVIQFIDNGIGIEEKYLEKIYELGYTTTDGSGIGLYHVQQIIQSLKGTITATNNPDDEGVSITIKLN